MRKDKGLFHPQHASTERKIGKHDTTASSPSLVKLNPVEERSVQRKSITLYGIMNLLELIGWGNIINLGGEFQHNLVHQFLSFIYHVENTPPIISVTVKNQTKFISPRVISRLICVKVTRIPVSERNLNGLGVWGEVTRAVCDGATIPRNEQNTLHVKYLSPAFKILHSIFNTNVYPCEVSGNMLSPYMLNVLYDVHLGIHICLPTLILQQLIRVSSDESITVIPFPCLVTKLSRHFGLPPTNDLPHPRIWFNQENICHIMTSTACGGTNSSSDKENPIHSPVSSKNLQAVAKRSAIQDLVDRQLHMMKSLKSVKLVF